MKTETLTKFHTGGYKNHLFLLTVFFLLTGTMSVQAVNYDLWIGGVQVTSNNCGNVTGGGIKSGTVVYNPNSGKLTLTDVTINCSGSYKDKQGIWNKGINNLDIHCYGNTTIYSVNNAGLQCDKKTVFFVESGTTWLESDNSRAAYMNDATCYFITESGSKLNITGYDCPAVEGVSATSGWVHFSGKNIELEGNKGNLVNLKAAYFEGYYNTGSPGWGGWPGCDVTLVATENINYPSVINVSSMGYINKSEYTAAMKSNSIPIITSPSRADFNSSQKSICDTSGNPIFNIDIFINEQFAVVVNANYFPDAKFRSFLDNKYGAYITQSQLNNCTSLDVVNMRITSLTGIEYFTELTSLDCYYNNITSLDLSSNTKLKGVVCDDNQLTSLVVPENNLQWLSCNNNNLTSCLRSKTYSYLKELYCANNPNMSCSGLGTFFSNLPALEKFDCSGTKSNTGTLNVSECTKLKELTCENITSLIRLDCTNTTLAKLMVSGCSNLNTIICNNNNLSYLDVYGCSSLKELVCNNNVLTSIAYMYGCKPALQKLNCSSNKFTSLDLSGYSKLQYLYCSGNQLTSLSGLSGSSSLVYVDCSNNQLTSLNTSSNPYLSTLKCNNNKLSTLTLNSLPQLQYLYCSNNSTLTSLALNSSQHPNLREVDCSYCNIGEIDWPDLRLTKLDCSYNSNLTSLENSRDIDNTVRPLSTLNVKGCSTLSNLFVYNNQLTTIDLSSCVNLSQFDCALNKLTSLNVSACTSLIWLECWNNQLTSLDVSNNRKLYLLDCSNNNISTLNVKNYTYLQYLDCGDNQLTSLDLRGCNALERVTCFNNQINSLILPQENTTLVDVECFGNCLEGPLMDVLIGSLPDRKNLEQGQIYMLIDISSEGNVCTWQNVRDARSKNWNVLYCNTDWQWVPYSGSGVPTAISTAEADNDGDAPRYNMSGQRVGHDYKGVVIVGGKKKVVK